MTLEAALLSCTVLGLQHGIDWDHVAAISDVASVQTTSLEATRCGLLYAVAHVATVGLLGIAAMFLKHSFPASLSVWMNRVVGATLILLGVYVFTSLFAGRQPLNRGQAILAMFGRGPDRRYGRKSSLSLGVLHGIGAETPTQLSMLVIATNLGGLQNGALSLIVFAAAMFASNMALTTAAAGAFSISKSRPAIFRWLGAVTAIYSLWIGIVMVR